MITCESAGGQSANVERARCWRSGTVRWRRALAAALPTPESMPPFRPHPRSRCSSRKNSRPLPPVHDTARWCWPTSVVLPVSRRFVRFEAAPVWPARRRALQAGRVVGRLRLHTRRPRHASSKPAPSRARIPATSRCVASICKGLSCPECCSGRRCRGGRRSSAAAAVERKPDVGLAQVRSDSRPEIDTHSRSQEGSDINCRPSVGDNSSRVGGAGSRRQALPGPAWPASQARCWRRRGLPNEVYAR